MTGGRPEAGAWHVRSLSAARRRGSTQGDSERAGSERVQRRQREEGRRRQAGFFSEHQMLRGMLNRKELVVYKQTIGFDSQSLQRWSTSQRDALTEQIGTILSSSQFISALVWFVCAGHTGAHK